MNWPLFWVLLVVGLACAVATIAIISGDDDEDDTTGGFQ